jgi:hypothetical protein
MAEAYRVAGKVDAWCGRCKLMLVHTVETISEGKPLRVHCNTCQQQHGFKPYEPGESPRQVRAKEGGGSPRSPQPGQAKASHYDTLLFARDKTLAKPYSPKTKFAPEDLVTHPTFGMGIVTSLKDGTKIEVVFPEGVKVLIHGR